MEIGSGWGSLEEEEEEGGVEEESELVFVEEDFGASRACSGMMRGLGEDTRVRACWKVDALGRIVGAAAVLRRSAAARSSVIFESVSLG
jgi:hypothetical protein